MLDQRTVRSCSSAEVAKESEITMAVVHLSISFARRRRRSLTHSCCEAIEIVG